MVCTYKRPKALARVLRSLQHQTLAPQRYEVIVVDNAPDGPEVESAMMESEGGMTLRYCIEPRLGLSFARNRGLREARAGVTAFIDDDAEASETWAESVLSAFANASARPLAVGGPVRPVWHTRQPSWLPETFLSTLSLVDYGAEARELNPEHEFLVGCNMAFDTAFLRESGGFAPDLGRRGTGLLGNEELHIQAGVLDRGGRLFYEPSALVRHHIQPERERWSWFLKRMYAQAVSDVLLQRHRLKRPIGRRLHNRVFGHLRPSLRVIASRPSHFVFTMTAVAAYAAGLVAGHWQANSSRE